AAGVPAQKLRVADLDRVPTPDRPDHARHDCEAASAVRRLAGVVEIDAVERGGEAIGIAFAALLAVSDNVKTGALLVADGEQRGIILRLFEMLGRDPPQLARAYPRGHLAGESRPVDQPFGLRIRADQRGGKQCWHRSRHGSPLPACTRTRVYPSSGTHRAGRSRINPTSAERSPSEAGRVGGTLPEQSNTKAPLTPPLSPQAGRGSTPSSPQVHRLTPTPRGRGRRSSEASPTAPGRPGCCPLRSRRNRIAARGSTGRAPRTARPHRCVV